MSGGTCHYCANRDCTCPPPARDWKPGEKVLVEATVIKLRPERDGYADVEIADHYYYADSGEVSDLEDPERIRLPLSSIHPMPRKEGE